MPKKQYNAIYGNTRLDKGFCKDCQSNAFVQEGKLLCCDALFELETRPIFRESEPVQKRVFLSQTDRNALLARQDWNCFYCGRGFGALVFRKGKEIRLRVEYDHLVPHSYSFNGSKFNFVAACHVCNKMKSNLMFNSVEEVQVYLHTKWKDKGYYD